MAGDTGLDYKEAGGLGAIRKGCGFGFKPVGRIKMCEPTFRIERYLFFLNLPFYIYSTNNYFLLSHSCPSSLFSPCLFIPSSHFSFFLPSFLCSL